MNYRGSLSRPILCVIVPLTEAVAAHLAQKLLRGCDPDAVDLRKPEESLQRVSHFHCPLLGKHFSLVTAEADNIFGCLDLVKLADWLILVLPSDSTSLDESANQFLTALYAQGMINTSFVVLSSNCDLREFRDNLEVSCRPRSTLRFLPYIHLFKRFQLGFTLVSVEIFTLIVLLFVSSPLCDAVDQ